MKDLHPIHSSAPAERWAAPQPACIPRVTKGPLVAPGVTKGPLVAPGVTKGPLVAPGDRPTYATDEGLQ